MISGLPGPQRPDLLRQYELGSVPYEMAEEKDEAAGAHDGAERDGRKAGRARRRWFRFWRKG